jgi:hypothetical protein
MDLEISPEPDAAERDAIAAAAAELLEDDFSAPGATPYTSSWRLVGLRENVADAGV